MVTRITDHADRALELQLTQFRDSSRLRGLVAILCAEVQQLEDLLVDLVDARQLATAEGVQLDHYGVLVGQKRLGLSDDDYRKLLGVRLVINRSNGTAVSVVFVASQLTGEPVRYRQRGQAHYSLEVEVGTPIGDAWLEVLNDAVLTCTPAGVSYELVEGSTDAFRFDTAGRGFDQGELGRRVDR